MLFKGMVAFTVRFSHWACLWELFWSMFWQKRDVLPCDALAGVVDGWRGYFKELAKLRDWLAFTTKSADGLNVLVGEFLARWLWVFGCFCARWSEIEVGGSHAKGIFACMMHLHAGWNRAVGDLKGDAMGWSFHPVYLNAPTVIAANTAPHRASVLIRREDAGEEAEFLFFVEACFVADSGEFGGEGCLDCDHGRVVLSKV